MLTLSLPAPAGRLQALHVWPPLPRFLPHLPPLPRPPRNGKPWGLSSIHPGRLEQAGPEAWRPCQRRGRRSPVARPRPPLSSRPGCREGDPQAPPLRKILPSPVRRQLPREAAQQGAVGGLLGLLAGQQQPLDVLGLQGEARTLLGHVDPRGRRRSGKRARSRCGLGPTATAAPPREVCPCREAARCAPLGVLGRAR